MLALAALVPQATLGQTSTGSIRGTVVDATGASIPNAAVRIVTPTQAESGPSAPTSAAIFDAPLLPRGDYDITAEFEGFQTKTLRGVALQVDQTAVLHIDMEPGRVPSRSRCKARPRCCNGKSSRWGRPSRTAALSTCR